MKNLYSIISQYEAGQELTPAEISLIVEGAATGLAPDDLLSQFLLDIQKFERSGRPLSEECAAAYTNAMAHSGLVFHWDDLQLPVAARHTPGIVGDTQSGPVDAILRACEIASINLTGTRLAHTPGTIERFSSIPGFQCYLSPEQIRSQMKQLGIVLSGQTKEIAPADGILYNLREKIGAVNCLAHICSSVMSKKIASGPKYLSLTVTYGPAAIMDTFENALSCARLMRSIGEKLGLCVVGEMFHAFDSVSRELGTGSLSMKSCIRILRNEAPHEETEVTLHSAAAVLLAAKKTDSFESALKLAQKRLSDGSAAEWFQKLVAAQGGDDEVVINPDKVLGAAPFQCEVLSDNSGYVFPNIKELGMIAHELTGPFNGPSWTPTAGISISEKGRYGEKIFQGDILALVHARDEQSAKNIIPRLKRAFQFQDGEIKKPARFSELPQANLTRK